MIEPTFPFLIPLITGLCEAAKQIGLSKRFIPPVALAIGIGLMLWLRADEELVVAILEGVAVGLGAVGLFSAFKNVGGKK